MTRCETLKLGCLCAAICIGLLVPPAKTTQGAAADTQGISINHASG